MTTYTRQELKQDRFATAAQSGASWIEANRNVAIGAAIAVIVLVIAIIAGASIYSAREEKAQEAFGQALKTYSANIRSADVPADPTQESYASTAERARASLSAFQAVADKYSTTQSGHDARYYAGIAAADMGQTSTAEDQLKKAADHGSADISSLAEMALASLYRSSSRDSQAVDIYKKLIDHPTNSVPAVASKLALASLYERTNLPEARKLWAQVKDQDKTTTGQPGAAGQVAADKLSGKA